MPIVELVARNAKPKDKIYRLYDTGGLYLEVAPSGGKWWRLKYRFGGKEKRLSLGVYPDVGLKEAREKRDESRKLLANNVDPSETRKAQKTSSAKMHANSFEVVAREWYQNRVDGWAPNHGPRILRRLERDIFPWIGAQPISQISPIELLTTVRRIEQREAIETAHRALANCSQVFRYGVATGRASRDITFDLRGALPPVKKQHFSAVTNPKQVSELLKTIDSYKGSLIVGCALRLAPLVFVRPGELRQALWSDIDFAEGLWTFVASKTKTPHVVPLSSQALMILQEIHPFTGNGRYVFPSARSASRPMSDNAILAAMRRLDIPKEQMTGHGFRAMARTILDEVLGFRPDHIEHQLGHTVRDPHGRAYNRTAHLSDRRKMMQEWSDYLDNLRA